MKLNGFVGKGSGKLGSSVFAISGGEQIVREYNPRVANPNTDAQVEQRAKLKLMSQLAAALAPGLGFKKMGLVSARNQFVAKNIGLCEFSNNEAVITLENLKLTPGQRSFVPLSITPGAENVVTISNGEAVGSDVKKAVLVVTRSDANDKLEIVAVKIAEVNNTQNFSVSVNNTTQGNLGVYAYGWIPTGSSNNVKYEDYKADVTGQEASLEAKMASLINGGVFTITSFGLYEA